jgi:hypothetical protein
MTDDRPRFGVQVDPNRRHLPAVKFGQGIITRSNSVGYAQYLARMLNAAYEAGRTNQHPLAVDPGLQRIARRHKHKQSKKENNNGAS